MFKNFDINGVVMTRIKQIIAEIIPTHIFPEINNDPIWSSFFCPIREAVNFEKTIMIATVKTERILKSDTREEKVP